MQALRRVAPRPQGARDARPTALRIVQDEGEEGKPAGKVMVTVGVTSGIGVETARAPKATGARSTSSPTAPASYACRSTRSPRTAWRRSSRATTSAFSCSSSCSRTSSRPETTYSFEEGGYNHEAAYNNSKLAAVCLANNMMHPGAISTDISRHMPPGLVEGFMSNPHILKIPKWPQQGAATTM
ncbi:hypothetical protein VTK26DRAFT_3778 [Humicola hyalothermophila]